MNKGGMIVRLIDVVMILLLGFLNISDIIHKKEIKLPSGKKASKSSSQTKTLRLTVNIVRSDTLISELENESSQISQAQNYGYYLVEENETRYHIRLLEKLEERLWQTHQEYDSVLVIIKPDSNSIVQGTISLIDICRQYGYRRMFDYGKK